MGFWGFGVLGFWGWLVVLLFDHVVLTTSACRSAHKAGRARFEP